MKYESTSDKPNSSNKKLLSWDELLEKGRSMPDSEDREAVYKELQEEIAAEAPWVFLNNGEVVVGAKANMKGFEPTAYGYHPLYNIYFE